MWLAWIPMMALADVIVLDNGSEVRGGIVSWREEGGCVLRLEEGPLEGVVVQLPCERIVRFSRDPVASAPAVPAPSPAPVADPVAAVDPAALPKSRSDLVNTLREEWALVR
nr:hypothetical protein [Deltaproteobacteria bacterium]